MRVILIMGDRDRRDSCASNVSRREDVNSLPYFYNNFKSTDEVSSYIKKCSRKKPGYYLLRPSNRQRNLLTASVSVKDGSVRHLHVQIEENGTAVQYFLVVEKKFLSIQELLDYYKTNPVRNLENVDDVYFKFSIDKPGSSPSGGTINRSRSVSSIDSARSTLSTTPAGPPPLPTRPRNQSTGSDNSSNQSSWTNGSVQENGAVGNRLPEAIANRPPAPLPAVDACDYGAYYSRARDVSEDISGKLKEVLNQSEVCECGISRNLAELPLGWTVHRSKDAATFGKLFYQSAEGQTSWFLPQNVKMQMTQKHMSNLRTLEGRSPKHSNSFNQLHNV